MENMAFRDRNYIGVGSQMLRLCLKDMSANKGVFLAVSGMYFVLSFIVLGIDKQFDVIFALFLSVFLVESLMQKDDRHKVEGLFCSLPVKRSAVVFARYLSSLLIVIALTGVTYLSVLVAHAVMPANIFHTGQGIRAWLVFLAVYLFVMFVSVSFHNHFRFGYTGYPMGLVINCVIASAVAAIPWGILYVFASLYSGSWELVQHMGKAGDIGGFILGVSIKTIGVLGERFFFIALTIFLTAFIVISIILSIKSYKKRDF